MYNDICQSNEGPVQIGPAVSDITWNKHTDQQKL